MDHVQLDLDIQLIDCKTRPCTSQYQEMSLHPFSFGLKLSSPIVMTCGRAGNDYIYNLGYFLDSLGLC